MREGWGNDPWLPLDLWQVDGLYPVYSTIHKDNADKLNVITTSYLNIVTRKDVQTTTDNEY
jgi:hypothetical protein